MSLYQPGILIDLPEHSRYLSFDIQPGATAEQVKTALTELGEVVDGRSIVMGIGLSVVTYLGKKIDGLRDLPVMSAQGISIPSTPAALWCWLRGDDRGDLFHRARQIEQIIFPAFVISHMLDGFMYRDSRDLSGYEDGTENPVGDDAVQVAIVNGVGAGIDGSSFVAVQQWLHDFDVMEDMSENEMDDIIGRHISDNEEFDDAPESAHVKRSAQESFEPDAFILRRSMPWVDGTEAGLNFIAFGRSFDAFEAILRRMSGSQDGLVDALFKFTRPINGACFWCPPLKENKLDISILI